MGNGPARVNPLLLSRRLRREAAKSALAGKGAQRPFPRSVRGKSVTKRSRSTTTTRLVYGTFGTLVAAFILYSTVEVIAVCFGFRKENTPPLPEACASGVRGLILACDRAVRASE